MNLALRPGTPEDAPACGAICYQAFHAVAQRHGFPSDFSTPDSAVGALAGLLSHSGFYSVVAELDGTIAGSNFLDERSTVLGVGPISVDPAVQDKGVGRALMHDVVERATRGGAPGVRLLQAAYHNRSLGLYARLGFQVRDVVACFNGNPPDGGVPGRRVRPATGADLGACNALCRNVHGHDRAGELRDALSAGSARVVEHDGRITGYATELAFSGHAVGHGNEDMKALIMAADAFGGPGILVPATNAELFRWCLGQDLRIVQSMTLMTIGMYSHPQGAYLPSVSF